MKNHISLTIVALLALFFTPQFAEGQWVQTNEPQGARVRYLAASDTNLVIVSVHGIFHSTNKGTDWKLVNPNGTYYYTPDAVVLNDTNLFETYYNRGVYLSTDYGKSWTQQSNFGLTTNDIRSLVSSDTNLFAGTYGGGVFLSTDNGTNWTSVSSGLKTYSLYVNTLAVKGMNLFAGTNGGVFLSTNNGANWTAVNTGLTNSSGYGFNTSYIALSGTNIFAVTYDSGVYHSTNNGGSWEQVNNGLPLTKQPNVPYLYVTAISINGSNIFAWGGKGIFLSTNNGSSWTNVNTGLIDSYIHSVVVSGTDILAGTDPYGVFLSTNNGTSWTPANEGLTFRESVSLAVSGTNLFATIGGETFLSTNKGENWVRHPDLPDISIFSKFVTLGGKLYAGMDRGLFSSTNNGTNWIKADTSSTISISSLVVSDTNMFIVYGNGGMARSTNQGINWTGDGIGNFYQKQASSLTVIGTTVLGSGEYIKPPDKNNGFIFHIAGGIVFDLPIGHYIHSFVVSNDIVYALDAGADNIYMSADKGNYFTTLNKGWKGVIQELVASRQNLFAGTDKGIFLSTDNGTSWESVGLENMSMNITSMIVSDSDLYVGTSYTGIWRRRLSEMIKTSVSPSEQPASFTLEQNHPNPFTTSTTISFTLAERGLATLDVFDVLGRKVRTLAGGMMDAGPHSVEFDAKNLSDGVYTAKLTVNGVEREMKTIKITN